MTFQAIVVLITAPSEEVGQQIANLLLEKKLAACVNIIPAVQSFFLWQGKACQEQEALLVVKTRAELFEDRLVPAVKEAHPYDVPEIIALPVVMGSKEYLDWVEEETSKQ